MSIVVGWSASPHGLQSRGKHKHMYSHTTFFSIFSICTCIKALSPIFQWTPLAGKDSKWFQISPLFFMFSSSWLFKQWIQVGATKYAWGSSSAQVHRTINSTSESWDPFELSMRTHFSHSTIEQWTNAWKFCRIWFLLEGRPFLSFTPPKISKSGRRAQPWTWLYYKITRGALKILWLLSLKQGLGISIFNKFLLIWDFQLKLRAPVADTKWEEDWDDGMSLWYPR